MEEFGFSLGLVDLLDAEIIQTGQILPPLVALESRYGRTAVVEPQKLYQAFVVGEYLFHAVHLIFETLYLLFLLEHGFQGLLACFQIRYNFLMRVLLLTLHQLVKYDFINALQSCQHTLQIHMFLFQPGIVGRVRIYFGSVSLLKLIGDIKIRVIQAEYPRFSVIIGHVFYAGLLKIDETVHENLLLLLLLVSGLYHILQYLLLFVQLSYLFFDFRLECFHLFDGCCQCGRAVVFIHFEVGSVLSQYVVNALFWELRKSFFNIFVLSGKHQQFFGGQNEVDFGDLPQKLLQIMASFLDEIGFVFVRLNFGFAWYSWNINARPSLNQSFLKSFEFTKTAFKDEFGIANTVDVNHASDCIFGMCPTDTASFLFWISNRKS